MTKAGMDCKLRANNDLSEGDTVHFRRWCVGDKMHHHGGAGLLTPYDIHFGVAAKRHAGQEAALRKAFEMMAKKSAPAIAIAYPEAWRKGIQNGTRFPFSYYWADRLI